MNNSLTELQRLIYDAVDDKKAFDIVILDLRNRTDITDFFLICSGNSRLQVQAISDSILEKTAGTSYKVIMTEGYSTGNWIIMDLSDMIVHIFQKETRLQYDLERLWGDVPIIETQSQEKFSGEINKV
ncbi:MAG: ribosome silencing factor [Nitrospinales bacterium]